MKLLITMTLCLSSAWANGQQGDPRLAIDEVRQCVENAKRFMRSADYTGLEKEQTLVAACRDTDPECVLVIGESFHPFDGADRAKFINLVKECRGRGMGKCVRAMFDTQASPDRREYRQIEALVRKCQ